jgi:hypothetical protein
MRVRFLKWCGDAAATSDVGICRHEGRMRESVKPLCCPILPTLAPIVGASVQAVGSVTLYGSIYKLRRASQPIALVMRPRSRSSRTLLTEVLVEAGLNLVAEGETAASLSSLYRARQVCGRAARRRESEAGN